MAIGPMGWTPDWIQEAVLNHITGTAAKEEDWTLDPLGNWSSFVQKMSGTTDLSQSRSVNKGNEITDISETTGSSWITPAYDRSGNMTTLPNSGNPTTSLTATYDAWNRLVSIADSSSTLATYAYDGLHRRIHATSSSVTRHFYHTTSWQTLEERLGTSSLTDRQYVWGPLYIDHLLCRDRDTASTPDGTLDERLYSLQDANWNVTSIVDSSGTVQERIGYAPYGHIQFLDASFSVRANSSFDIRTTYTGREWIPEIGLYYFRNRWHHAELGSFSSNDPIGFEGSERNLYEYAHANPIENLDPSGERTISYPSNCTAAMHKICNDACVAQ